MTDLVSFASQTPRYYKNFFNLETLYHPEPRDKRTQHLIEMFSGTTLPAYWTINNVQGTNTFAMRDEIDGGFQITTDTTSGDTGSITFNNKRFLDPDNCVVHWVGRRITAGGDAKCYWGASQGNNRASNNSMWAQNEGDDSFWRLRTKKTSSANFTDSSISVGLTLKYIKLTSKDTFVTMHMTGVLEVTRTNNIPDELMQPCFTVRTSGAAAKSGVALYCEAYNT